MHDEVDGFGDDTIDKFDPRRFRVVRRIHVGSQPYDVAYAAGSVWSSNFGDGTVSRIDPRRGRVVATIRTGGQPGGLRYATGSLWVG